MTEENFSLILIGVRLTFFVEVEGVCHSFGFGKVKSLVQ